MLSFIFMAKCFGVGLLSTLGVGPIFILTFNRSAMYGFWKGVITAAGAAIADGILFALGLLGVLTILSDLKHGFLFMDLIGGIVLIGFGIHTWYKKVAPKELRPRYLPAGINLLRVPVKSFLIAILNPMAIIYFGFWSTQILPANFIYFTSHEIILSSFIICVGTFLGLVVVSLIASSLGSCIVGAKLVRVAHVTGVLFFLIGCYFMYDFISALVKMYIL
jgi:threonine/homoserine/homoserine lactone efflux protein